MFAGGCLFIDHASNFVHVEFQKHLNTHPISQIMLDASHQPSLPSILELSNKLSNLLELVPITTMDMPRELSKQLCQSLEL
jgi:hypothetical protein